MPASKDTNKSRRPSQNEDFEDIEILKNLLELRSSLRKEGNGIDAELE